MIRVDIICNPVNKTIVCALPRCGTNYLNSFARKNQDWRANARFGLAFRFEEQTVVKVIRDPFERWRSWFYSFAFDPNVHPFWTVDDSDKFIKNFDIMRHYDQHTGYQSILYNMDTRFNHNNIYVRMENIGVYLGDAGQPHSAGTMHAERERVMNDAVKDYMYSSIRQLYQNDHDWIKSLDLWGETC